MEKFGICIRGRWGCPLFDIDYSLLMKRLVLYVKMLTVDELACGIKWLIQNICDIWRNTMNEQIKEIYPKLLMSVETINEKMAGTIDLSEIAYVHTTHVILKELNNENLTIEEKKQLRDYYNDMNLRYQKRKMEEEAKKKAMDCLPKTEAEAFFFNARLLHDIDINYKLNTVHLISENIKDFYQLSIEGLESYIYWRTNLRKGILIDSSSGFMYLYLKEVCGVIEHESPKEAFEHLLYLYEMASNIEYVKKYMNIIIRAIKFVSTIYYDKIPKADMYIKKYFRDLNTDYDMKKYLLDGKYERCIEYINCLSLYKFKDSSFYKGNKEFYEKCLIRGMKEFMKLCDKSGFDFVRACIGSHKELRYEESLFYRNSDLWYEGKINLENGYYVRVWKGKISETVISRTWQMNDTIEKAGGMLYYLVWYLEKVTRNYMGIKRNVRPNLKMLEKIGTKSKYQDDFTKLKYIYTSEEFEDMIKNVVEEEYKELYCCQ